MQSVATHTGTDAVHRLVGLLRDRRIAVLTGAGCSTESGIPDYRGPGSAARSRAPIQYLEFTGHETARVRYWARSAVGWPRVAQAAPNAAHEALAALERAGVVSGVITQNVDGLHGKAGSVRVVELHGSLSRVRCLWCRARIARTAYQDRLLADNPVWAAYLFGSASETARVAGAPDGDAGVPDHLLDGFRVPPCAACGGICKPDVVFFGENVPPATLADAWRVFESADVLLVAGSSLTVFSGRRFVYRARDEGMPVAIVNLGPTRGDDLATVTVDRRLGEVLPRLALELTFSCDASVRRPRA